jgi:hypothetical protein
MGKDHDGIDSPSCTKVKKRDSVNGVSLELEFVEVVLKKKKSE